MRDQNGNCAASFDLVLLGGGLSNCLTALAVLERAPDTSIALVERGNQLGGNHTWCWHSMDAPGGAEAWLAPLRVHRWSGYDLHFPDRTQHIEGDYALTHSARLHERVTEAMANSARSRCFLGVKGSCRDDGSVALSDGRVLHGRYVLAATGPVPVPSTRAGFQKFVGVEFDLEQPHGLRQPMLMDATVPQRDGFRFMYVLPLGPRRMLVEDTVFSPQATLDVAAGQAEVAAYATRFGPVAQTLRVEHGVLPMPFRDDAVTVPDTGPIDAGYAGGYFHPGTGYSMPVAIRFALVVAGAWASDPTGLRARLRALAEAHNPQAAYARVLNGMLFRCFAPEDMWNVFSRFYRLPESTIHRFYALELTRTDRARLLLGLPPRGFSLRRGWRALRGADPAPASATGEPGCAGGVP